MKRDEFYRIEPLQFLVSLVIFIPLCLYFLLLLLIDIIHNFIFLLIGFVLTLLNKDDLELYRKFHPVTKEYNNMCKKVQEFGLTIIEE